MVSNRLKFVTVIALLFTLLSCGGGEGENGQPKFQDESNKSGNLSLVFKASSFNQYIDFSEDSQWVRIKFGFFPDGTNFDFPNKRIIIPCDFENPVPEGVDVNLSAPVGENSCGDPLVLSVADEGESLSVEGIVLHTDKMAFAKYDLEIDPEGIKLISTGELIVAPKGKLAEYVLNSR